MSMQPMMQPIFLPTQGMAGMPMVPGIMPPMQAAMPMIPPVMQAPMPVPQPAIASAMNNQVGVQRYMPVSSTKRPFSEAENVEIKKGEDQWIPTIGNNYSTPVPSLLASPTKAGLMSGALLGGLVAMATRMLASGSSNVGLKVAIGALIGGGIGAFTGYIHRKQKNGDMLDLMQRLPEGATKRDLLSDPVYQSDLSRRSGGSSYGSTDAMMTGMLAGSMMSRPYSSSHSNGRPSSYHSSSKSSSK